MTKKNYNLTQLFYKLLGKPIPTHAKYPLWLLCLKPIRKYINVVIIPNIPSSQLRNIMYRLIGFKIGANVFIGMKCYMDDMNPSKTVIEDNVIISYGCYFAIHGKNQSHTTIRIKEGAYIGMRCDIISGKTGIEIGEHAVVGAGSLVNKSIPNNSLAVGVPAKVIKYDTVYESNVCF